MPNPMITIATLAGVLQHFLLRPWPGGEGSWATRPNRHDRGAVSIEHVLWYAAAAVSVAVVAAIIWSQIRTTASTPVQSPASP